MSPAALAVVLAAVAAPPERPARPIAAQIERPTILRAAPGGKAIAKLGRRTEFGSRTVLAVAARRGAWLAVRAPQVGNDEVGFIPARVAKVLGEPHSITVDLSERRMVVRTDGRVSGRYRVAVGAPATPTPTGTFAVTDRVVTRRPGGPYGCCILALNGRQPNLPQGWGGGDRLAIHGTSNEQTLGAAVSSGCVRASKRTMRALMRRIPQGAPVVIRP
jgi:lipoprotein-anchoring transpeptidase ErfK/SrfK